MFLAFIGVAVIALGGAVLLLIWISSMTPIQATDERTPVGALPTAQGWVDEGAVLFVVGEVDAVYGPEWTTSDGSRPGTPWEVSSVPEDIWIQTPMLIDLDDAPIILNERAAAELDRAMPEVDLILALRGGEIGQDQYEVIDGQDRHFEPGDRVGLVLTVKDADLDEPNLIGTMHGEGWEFQGRYHLNGDTAEIHWGEESGEYELEALVEEFRDAAQ
jgi:hypothetical protein